MPMVCYLYRLQILSGLVLVLINGRVLSRIYRLEKSRMAEGDKLPCGGSGGISPRTFCEMNMP